MLRGCRWVPPDGQRALLVTFMALFSIFAARKYTQPVKDDLGDKSVRGLLSAPVDVRPRTMFTGDGDIILALIAHAGLAADHPHDGLCRSSSS